MFNKIWATISSASVLRGIATIVLVLLLGAAVILAFFELPKLSTVDMSPFLSLPILAIGGVIVLILVLTIVATIFGFLGLTDKDQAMGLPEGSIRSVIALSLIVLFAILAVFLYVGVSGGPPNVVENLTDADRVQFLKDHAAAKDLQSIAVVKDKAGKPLVNADGTAKTLYTVTYRTEPNQTSNDFAKQLLVILGTLMTAITSFYLGAGTATSAAAVGAQTTTDATKPIVASINPKNHSLATGTTIHLEVMGKDLNVITHVKIVRAGVQVIGTNVASNPLKVTCDLAVSAANIGGPWDVVVNDGASKSATLPAALTITQ